MAENETNTQIADIAIIGSGPAGVSAAITSAVRGKSILLFGDMSDGSKLARAHQINNYPGFYGKTGKEIQAAFKSHLKSLDIKVTPSKITNIYQMGKTFTLLAGQEQYEAKAVIVAIGVNFGKAIPGEEEFLGKGVSYCATCDGMLYRKKTVAVLAYSKAEEKEAAFLVGLTAKVYYMPLYKESVDVDSRCEIIKGTPSAIKGDKFVKSLELNSVDKSNDDSHVEKKSIDVDGVFILRDSIPPAQLIDGVKMDGTHIDVDRQMKTNIPGLFAAGDITGTPYQYIKAAGEGNIAALSAVSYLG